MSSQSNYYSVIYQEVSVFLEDVAISLPEWMTGFLQKCLKQRRILSEKKFYIYDYYIDAEDLQKTRLKWLYTEKESL